MELGAEGALAASAPALRVVDELELRRGDAEEGDAHGRAGREVGELLPEQVGDPRDLLAAQEHRALADALYALVWREVLRVLVDRKRDDRVLLDVPGGGGVRLASRRRGWARRSRRGRCWRGARPPGDAVASVSVLCWLRYSSTWAGTSTAGCSVLIASSSIVAAVPGDPIPTRLPLGPRPQPPGTARGSRSRRRPSGTARRRARAGERGSWS